MYNFDGLVHVVDRQDGVVDVRVSVIEGLLFQTVFILVGVRRGDSQGD